MIEQFLKLDVRVKALLVLASVGVLGIAYHSLALVYWLGSVYGK